jgi:predicted metal-dependent enzyme (double-stranded beta helix superfamily)
MQAGDRTELNPQRFRDFIARFTALVAAHGGDEPRLLADGAALLRELVRHDDWLPQSCAEASPESYRQYLLHCDPLERFSVVSFVWGPDQRTPIHDHTVWGLVAVMRGAELCSEYAPPLRGQAPTPVGEHRVLPGEIDRVSPAVGDVHVVANALADQSSLSIHVYGANIGAVRRHVFDPVTGEARDFVSGYHNSVVPNFWDRAADVRRSLQR